MSINIQGKLRIKGLTTGGNPGGGPNYTFTTTQIGGTNYFQSNTTTGYIKFNSTVYISNDEVQFTLDDPNGEYTLVSCLSDGTPSGDITSLTFNNGNQITSFDGVGLSGLTNLYLDNNQLTSFDGTGLSSLTTLYLDSNQLTTFDGTGLSSLTELYLTNNQLTSFDGTGLTSLTILNLDFNQLTSFDGTGLSSLTTLQLPNNQLTSFDGTGLSSLTSLALSNNLLTSFDSTGLTSLIQLYITNNLLDSSDNNSILAQLDTNGLIGGNFFSSGGRTSASDTNYNNLIGKLWNIDVNA